MRVTKKIKKKFKRLICSFFVFLTVFSSVSYSYMNTPVVVHATGLEGSILNWFVNLVCSVGYSFTQTEQAQSALENFKDYVAQQAVEVVENSKDTVELTTSGVFWKTQAAAYVMFYDKLFNGGDYASAVTYANDNGILADSFSALVDYVKSYFSNLVDLSKNVIGDVQNIFSTISLDFASASFSQFVANGGYSITLSSSTYSDVIKCNRAISLFKTNYFDTLSDINKSEFLGKLGDKYLIVTGYDSYYEASLISFYDLPDDICCMYTNNGSLYYSSNNETFYRLDTIASSSNLIGSYKIRNVSDTVLPWTNGVSSPTFNTTNNKYSGMYLSQFSTSTNILDRLYDYGYVQFMGTNEVVKYTSIETWQSGIPMSESDINNYTNDYEKTNFIELVSVGTPIDVPEDKSIEDVIPVDADTIITNTQSGDYTAVQEQVNEAVNPPETPTTELGFLGFIYELIKGIVDLLKNIYSAILKLDLNILLNPINKIVMSITSIATAVTVETMSLIGTNLSNIGDRMGDVIDDLGLIVNVLPIDNLGDLLKAIPASIGIDIDNAIPRLLQGIDNISFPTLIGNVVHAIDGLGIGVIVKPIADLLDGVKSKVTDISDTLTKSVANEETEQKQEDPGDGGLFNIFDALLGFLLIFVILTKIFLNCMEFIIVIFSIPADPYFLNEGMIQGLDWLKTTQITGAGFSISLYGFMMSLINIIVIFAVVRMLRHNIDKVKIKGL